MSGADGIGPIFTPKRLPLTAAFSSRKLSFDDMAKGTPYLRRTNSTPSAWSKWPCVLTARTGFRPCSAMKRSRAAFSRSEALPASITAHSAVSSHTT